jgi:hypothetical protein
MMGSSNALDRHQGPRRVQGARLVLRVQVRGYTPDVAWLVHAYRIVTLCFRPVSDRHAPARQQHVGDSDYRHVPSPRRRGGMWGELALAVPPTLVVVAVLLTIEGVARQRLLFASLASSAFLIYYAPREHMNGIRVMAIAQAIGCCTGVVGAIILGAGYGAGACAMVVTIFLLITFDIVHPPAISTAIGFAFVAPKDRTLLLFSSAIVLLGVLVVIQRLAMWTLRRVEKELTQ